jgi:hypothetical protein
MQPNASTVTARGRHPHYHWQRCAAQCEPGQVSQRMRANRELRFRAVTASADRKADWREY